MLQFISPIERTALYVRDIPKNDKQIEGVIRKYGFDKPMYVQYWRWLTGTKDPVTGKRIGGILFGDFGYSRTSSQPVSELIKNRFPNTLDLTIWAVAPVILVGIWMGVQAAVHHNGIIDQGARMFSIVGTSFPTFVVGLLLLMLFYATLQWLEPGRISDEYARVVASPSFKHYTSLLSFDSLLNGRIDIQQVAILQHHRCGGGQQFGNAGEAEAGVGIDRQLPVKIAISGAAGPDDLAVPGHGGSHAGNAVGFYLSGEDGIGDLLLCGRRGAWGIR